MINFTEEDETNKENSFFKKAKNDYDNACKETIGDMTIVEFKKMHIYMIENILDASYCDLLVENINKLPLKKTDYYKNNNVRAYYANICDMLEYNDDLYYCFSTDDNKYKKLLNFENIYISQLNLIEKIDLINIKDFFENKLKEIEVLFKKHKKLYFNFSKYSDLCLRKIYGKTRLHCDGFIDHNSSINYIEERGINKIRNMLYRELSVIFSLNDNYDGGYFYFPQQDITIKMKKGSVLFFPPYFTHSHEVSELYNNTYRYTLNTWTLCSNNL